MTEHMSADDFVSKIIWEGGVLDALDYGLRAESIQEGSDDALRSAWAELQSAYETFGRQVRQVEVLLEEYE